MFNKQLFLSLCEKYGVEFSETATEPMIRLGSRITPINDDVLTALFSPNQAIFIYSTDKNNILIDTNGFCSLADTFAIAC